MKREYIRGHVSGIIEGIIICAVILFLVSPGVMIKEKECRYGFDDTISLLDTSAADHGWKIIAVHDLQESMRKAGKEVNRVKVFELCNPGHAYQVLKGDRERVVSAMMPCRLAVYEKSGGKVYISFMNARPLATAFGGIVKRTMRQAVKENEAIIAPLLIEK